jgi:hypothetical protein
MTTRKELAQKLAELPTFNLRFGSRVDIFNLPASDRDLIVQALQESDDLANQGQALAAEFEKLREKIRTLLIERDELANKLKGAVAERTKLDERYRSVAAEHASLEARLGPLTEEHARLDTRHKALVVEHQRSEETCRAITTKRDSLLGKLVGVISGEEDAISAASWLQSNYPESAATIRSVPPTGGWRTIDSAPKDNSLVNLIGRSPTGRVLAPVATRRDMISADAGIDHWLDWPHAVPPTHWCPIPAPPPMPPVEQAKEAAIERKRDAQTWLSDDLRFLSQANKG